MTLANVKFDENGLLPAIVQDARTGRVLTLAYMNAESLERTLETKETWFWSRSRNQLWHKGETSGNSQRVVAVTEDCDHDALLIEVEPLGPACHTGAESCFHNQLRGMPTVVTEREFAPNDLGATLASLYGLVETRKRERPEGSYTTYLFDQGLDKILKKVGEEATETIIAAKGEETVPLISESADLIYHLIVLLVERGVNLDQVSEELNGRRTKANGK
jgi:phosphoribosyl-ATP pyrophosphohydrolase/phosphoribosyl-AMP cyclohydrolase